MTSRDDETAWLRDYEVRADNLGASTKTSQRPPAYFAPRCDLSWLTAVTRLPGKALNVALLLLHMQRLTKSDTVHVRPSLLADFNLTRQAYYRGVDALASAGLITVVEKTRGRAATVRVMSSRTPHAPT